MKTKINYCIFSALIIAAFYAASCQKDEVPETWNISGKVVMTDAQVPEIKTPLEGVKIYLLNGTFSLDTTFVRFSENDILDSVKTDADGLYSFHGLEPGGYVVLPNDTSTNYRFDWSESPDSPWIDANSSQKKYEINFSVPETVMENPGHSW
ncbi:MAG: carboxypeptidase-like regulatory domain-containing protein [Tangfeifania sp.]